MTVISHTNSKEGDARKMGASHFIATHDDDKIFKKNKRTLDLIICTTNDNAMPLTGYLDLLKPGGKLIFVGLPEGGLPKVAPSKYILNGISIGGSAIGVSHTIIMCQNELICGDSHPPRSMKCYSLLRRRISSAGSKSTT